MALSSLISADDWWDQLVRAVAATLALDTAEQVRLATAAGAVDPSWWNLKVYQERDERMADLVDGDLTPVVSVSLRNVQTTQHTSAGSAKHAVTISCDCYGFGRSDEQDPLGSYNAARYARRAATLVRNILDCTENRGFGMRRAVVDHIVQGADMFHDSEDPSGTYAMAVARVTLKADVLQANIDRELQALSALALTCYRESDGLVYVQEEFTL
jgi:hypothetical protein